MFVSLSAPGNIVHFAGITGVQPRPKERQIGDAQTFYINNGMGSGNIVFEFDKDGVQQAGGILVQIPDDLTIVVPADGSLRMDSIL